MVPCGKVEAVTHDAGTRCLCGIVSVREAAAMTVTAAFDARNQNVSRYFRLTREVATVTTGHFGFVSSVRETRVREERLCQAHGRDLPRYVGIVTLRVTS